MILVDTTSRNINNAERPPRRQLSLTSPVLQTTEPAFRSYLEDEEHLVLGAGLLIMLMRLVPLLHGRVHILGASCQYEHGHG
jgi:hypothetical protein